MAAPQACDGSTPEFTTTGTTTTTAPEPVNCNQYMTDNFCDDENNNSDCGYDGGACCNNSNPNWKDFCSVSFINFS